MPWSRPTKDAIPHLIRSMPRCQACIQARGGPYKLKSTILSCCNEISAKWTSLLHHFFHFDFRGVFEFSPLYVGHFNFHQTMWHPFILNTLPSPL